MARRLLLRFFVEALLGDLSEPISLETRLRPVPRIQRASHVVIDALEEYGVDVVFGLPGGTVAPIFDALLDKPTISVVTTKHESAAVFAAIGYARLTGRLGVALVTSGPGILNTMTALASAQMDGVPILILGGEVTRAAYGKGALQEGSAYSLNIVAMTSHISKLAVEIPNGNAVPTMIRRAIETALSGKRGPVVVTLPIDVSSAQISVPRVSRAVTSAFELDDEAVDEAARALLRSQSRAILAGSGLRNGRGSQLLIELAERLRCPVITTPKGKGVMPEDHPLCVGVFGMGAHPSASDLIKNGLDTLLAVGTSLGDLATGGWSEALNPRRTLIHVDIDGTRIGRVYTTHISIAAPADVFFERMLRRVTSSGTGPDQGIRYHTDPSTFRVGSEGRIAPQRALWELQQVLPESTVYTVDSGEHTIFSIHYLRAFAPDTFMVMTGLGAMGSAIPAALGAKMAKPDRPVVVIIGDGGFAMTATEISTAALEGAGIIVAVFNDERLGMVELGHNALYGRSPEFPVGPLNIPKMAEALGAEAVVIEHPDQILALGERFAARTRTVPLVLDIRIDRSVKMPKHSRFEKLAADIGGGDMKGP